MKTGQLFCMSVGSANKYLDEFSLLQDVHSKNGKPMHCTAVRSCKKVKVRVEGQGGNPSPICTTVSPAPPGLVDVQLWVQSREAQPVALQPVLVRKNNYLAPHV